MALIAYVGRPVEPHLALLVGAGAYVGAIGALGVFTPDEIDVLRGLVARVRGRTAEVTVGVEA